jgi:hypothetical protein
MSIETSLVVQFGDGAEDSSYLFHCKEDSELNGDKSSFIIGDEVNYQVNHSNNVEILRVVSTDGDVRRTYQLIERELVEEVLFAEDDIKNPSKHQLSVIPSETLISYIGRVGDLTKSILHGNIVEYAGNISKVPFRTKFEHKYICDIFTLSSPNMPLAANETYTIDVVFYIRVT